MEMTTLITLNSNCQRSVLAPICIEATNDCSILRRGGEGGSEAPIDHTYWACLEVSCYLFTTAWSQGLLTPRKTPEDYSSWESALEDHVFSRTWQVQWWLLCKTYLTVHCGISENEEMRLVLYHWLLAKPHTPLHLLPLLFLFLPPSLSLLLPPLPFPLQWNWKRKVMGWDGSVYCAQYSSALSIGIWLAFCMMCVYWNANHPRAVFTFWFILESCEHRKD